MKILLLLTLITAVSCGRWHRKEHRQAKQIRHLYGTQVIEIDMADTKEKAPCDRLQHRADESYLECMGLLKTKQTQKIKACLKLLPDFTQDYLDCLEDNQDDLQEVQQRQMPFPRRLL